MNESMKTTRALGLCSGGLDSILSALVLRRQGIEVEWVTFETPFFSADNARKASERTGVPLSVVNFTGTYLEMLLNPPFGYGQNMNPCPDCHALMFRTAGAMMREKGFDFLFSGEVAGQRPMSQNTSSLRYVEKHSGFDGYVVRPLSAKNLPITIPETEGLVDREKLLDFSGRSRKPQMMLAEEFGIFEYPSPAGGCLLTEKVYSERLYDYFIHLPKKDAPVNSNKKPAIPSFVLKIRKEGLEPLDLSVIDPSHVCESDLHLLKNGRHFRLESGVKVIVGRNKADNDCIQKYADPTRDVLMKTSGFSGPIGVVSGKASREDLLFAAEMLISYSKVPEEKEPLVMMEFNGEKSTAPAQGVSPDKLKPFMV